MDFGTGSIGVSIVLYQTDEEEVRNAVEMCLACDLVRYIHLVDNSPEPSKWDWIKNEAITYTFTGKNLGYGSGHNIALRSITNRVPYALILNSDVKFDPMILSNLKDELHENQDISAVGPKIYYENGELQHSIKMLPTPLDLLTRRFILYGGLFPKLYKISPHVIKPYIKKIWDMLSQRHEFHYELLSSGYNQRLHVQSISGCFIMVRSKALEEIGFFDERYFMYAEDVDLSRRLAQVGSVLFVPDVHIIHAFRKASYINKDLGRHHIQSMIKYFNKWGWVFDKKRRRSNAEIKSRFIND